MTHTTNSNYIDQLKKQSNQRSEDILSMIRDRQNSNTPKQPSYKKFDIDTWREGLLLALSSYPLEEVIEASILYGLDNSGSDPDVLFSSPSQCYADVYNRIYNTPEED
tara:strand:+ start:69 stop:392 length:324 start_codon:yes stop_codon:yes gene_type:complete